MKKGILLSVCLATGMMLACNNNHEKEEPAGQPRLTAIIFNGINSGGEQQNTTDTIAYDAEGRCVKYGNIVSIAYQDDKLTAECGENPYSATTCTLTLKNEQPDSIFIKYLPQLGMVSRGAFKSTKDSMVMDLSYHSTADGKQLRTDRVVWNFDKDGALEKRSQVFTKGDEVSRASAVYVYDPRQKAAPMPAAFYLNPMSIQDLVLLVGGYAPFYNRKMLKYIDLYLAPGQEKTQMNITYETGPDSLYHGAHVVAGGMPMDYKLTFDYK